MDIATNTQIDHAAEPIPFKAEGPQPLLREIPPGESFPVEALGPLKEAVNAATNITQTPRRYCRSICPERLGIGCAGLRRCSDTGRVCTSFTLLPDHRWIWGAQECVG